MMAMLLQKAAKTHETPERIRPAVKLKKLGLCRSAAYGSERHESAHPALIGPLEL
jgi:hypothetical protein